GQVEYDDIRDAMIADASDSERPLVERLPELADLQTVGGTATGFVNITRANAKALGLDLDSITWNFPATCFTVDCDGIFTVSDGLPLDTYAPLTSLVLHEVGHALGFVSTLGQDLDDDDLSTLDMFRLEPGQGDVDFTNAPRVVAQGIDSVFYDGKYDSTAHTAPLGLTVGDIPMSTGDPSPPGDGNQPSHFKNLALNGGVIIGVMDPIIQPSTIDDPISDADLSVLGLIGWDVTDATVPPPNPGDWQSIELSTFAHDRNIGVVVEREIGQQNENPETAQVLGALAPNEKAGDDNQRLGFQVHGQISDPDDVDVYSFKAQGGTEVWLDIDDSSYVLDTVVELVDVQGNGLFRSDNSIEEASDWSLLSSDNEGDGVFPLEKSSHEIADHWTTNPRDAGMRVVLPGEASTVNTYHVRVSSNNTGGRYELQVRLRELGEPAGSTIQFADIRYATNAIEIVGQTVHSPLSGEVREAVELAGDPPLDTPAGALQMGNLLETDRSALSIAGHMRDDLDVDFFEFEISYEHVSPFALQDYPQYPYAVVLDLDYADGLARANTSLDVFAGGTLILTGHDSNIAEDRPGPLRGIDMKDLSRGTVGGLDPLLGTVELPGGTTYQVAVSTESLVPEEMDQFINTIPVNPGLRLEPIPVVGRIVEDHIAETFFSTQKPPQVPVLVGDDGIVPYHIGDVVLFISQDTGVDQTTVTTVDGFTGALETTVGSFNRDVGDIDIRGVDDRMYTFTLDLEDGNGPGDGQAGNYIQIDTGDGTLINPCGGTLQDDNVQTNHENIANPGNPIASNVGMHYDAMTYAAAGLVSPLEDGFVVGHRPKNAPTNQFVTGGTDNVLYRFDPECGDATSGPLGDRTGTALIEGAGTNIRERGILDTTVDSNGTGFSWILASEATEVAPDGTTTTLIADGTRFLIEGDGNLLTPAVEFEFNGGPEVYFGVDPANGIFVRDGDGFTLDGQPYEFNTGSVLVIIAQNGSQLNDGDTISITDKNGQLKNFEFDSGNGVGPGSEKIDFTNGMSQPQLVSAIISAINGAANFEVQASTLSATSNRITLVDDSTTSNPSTTSASIVIQGTAGGSGGSGTQIEIEETFNDSQFSDAIVTKFTQLPAITVSP
ncbi:MAG: NF038122 family metalloprotease, partial [Pirellulaceae bacterium]